MSGPGNAFPLKLQSTTTVRAPVGDLLTCRLENETSTFKKAVKDDLSSRWQSRRYVPRTTRNRILVTGGDPGEPELVRIHRVPQGTAAVISRVLFSKPPGEWLFRLARPVFLTCLIALLLATALSMDRMLRYVSYPLASTLLPLLGIVMALICLLGKDLDVRFKRTALIVATLTSLAGVLAPALQNIPVIR